MDTDEQLALANAITKALLPDLYGKPGLSGEQVAAVLGMRGIVFDTIGKHFNENPRK